MTVTPKLIGTAGHVIGEELALEYGRKIVVGRSRSADWSLVRMKSWSGKTEDERNADDAFRTVSGKHFEITMFNLGSIELVNLSPNGTLLDGKPVTRTTLTDVASTPHEIRFGADEIVRLEAKMQEEAPKSNDAPQQQEQQPQPPAQA